VNDASALLWMLGLVVLTIAYVYVRRPAFLSNRGSSAEVNQQVQRILESTQAQLQEGYRHRAQFETLMGELDRGVLLVDRALRVVQWNAAAAPALNRALVDLAPGDSLQSLAASFGLVQAVEEAVATRQPVTRELRVGQDRAQHLLARVVPVQIGDLAALIIVADQSAASSFEELRREFVTNVTHELKTPLTNIAGATETLLAGAAKDPAARERFLDIIRRNSDQLRALIEDLLTIARSEEPVPVPEAGDGSEYRQVRGQILADLAAAAEAAGVHFVHQELAHPVPIAMPSPDLYAVLKNLVENAIRYNKSGGVVEFSERVGDRTLEVSIRDTGEGISPADLPRIFERFYRADKQRSRVQGGTGLGLSIAKNLVERYGGELGVVSALGYGSTFTVTVPLQGDRMDVTEP